jgi:pimeloyl-ACP methyl ester carboxylesterase
MSRHAIALLLLCTGLLRADGPADNVVDRARPIPPPGIALPPRDRDELQKGVDALGQDIENLRKHLAGKPGLLQLLPDVQVFHNAVRYALAYNEFFDLKEIPVAREILLQGGKRAESLRDGKAPWTVATGLVVRGYVSRIDGSVQPYGLVVPGSFHPGAPYQHRLDLWCHGRGEKLTELNFVNDRMKSPGQFTPPHAFVLHLYGRYCNANKFAGEIDAFEAMDRVKRQYPIDEDRVVVRGFSMGGAACWQFAVHYPGTWAAAAPGAGFSETPEFLKFFQKETLNPEPFEKTLWQWYDCTDYALNLSNLPTVAYSGEIDVQKQAADAMAVAMKREGLELLHVVGPNTGHGYHPAAKREIDVRIDAIAAVGRNPLPRRVRFTTPTLRYNQCFWLTVDGLEHHWQKARVDAEIVGPRSVTISAQNVTALSLDVGPGRSPFDPQLAPEIVIDGQRLVGPPVLSDRSWKARLRKYGKGWQVAAGEDFTVRKKHGLQGPIDDAFLDSFLFVRPTGKPWHEKTGAWVDGETSHAVAHWRNQFRGEARIKSDEAVTPADVVDHNLVLWGDPASNKVLAKIVGHLPLTWDADRLRIAGKEYDAATHVPLLIFPNPLNPRRYVVLNSGFTYREYDYLNNARQVPRLPDWAVVDVRTPPSPRWPGKVVHAGFFDERWQMPGAAK